MIDTRADIMDIQIYRRMERLELLLLSVICLLVQARHPDLTGDCDLDASELGPDWYKVPQPIPTVFADDPDYMRTYIHMPCAATTVFDVAICGCTNLMSFLYSTMEYRDHPPSSASHHNKTAPPGDWVKTMAPVPTTKAPPAGSILLNTKTGEIRQCPFRSSPQGPEWYLMHEPNDSWRPMRCAPGTLFYKKHCTCVHAGAYNDDNGKLDDSDIVVLEDEFDSKIEQKNSLSNALGISASDVKFERGAKSEKPYWRQEEPLLIKDTSLDRDNTLNTNPNIDAQRLRAFKDVENITIPLGKDAISTQHKLRLLRRGPIPFIRKEAATLTIDSKLDENVRKVNVINVDTKADLKDLDNMIENMKKEKIPKQSKNYVEVDAKDHVIIFAHKECSKRPITELGPQFFQLYIYGFGLVPYICNGDRVYDDSKCACVLTPKTSTLDEVNFPITECHKRAAPELGPEYFQMYQWGYGFTPYKCHRDFVYNAELCACAKP